MVTDNSGAVSKADSVVVTVNAANIAPVANAGADQSITLPSNSVVLDGSSSKDFDGTVATYKWSEVSGPNTASFSPNSTLQKPIVSGLVAGSYVFALVVTDNSGAVSKADSVVVTVNGGVSAVLVPGSPVYRINAGGPQVTNSIGTFAADAYYSPIPGNTFSIPTTISGTTNGEMYQTERFGTNGTFSYAFPVTNGNYTVVLHFAEIYWTSAGKRLFDVSIEGNKVLDNYDIFKKVGAFTATSETFSVNVTDGTLNLYFSSLPVDGGVDQPKVSAIEILSSVSANIAPVAKAGIAQSIILPTSNTVLDGSASSDADGTIASYSWSEISGPNTASFSPAATAQKPTLSGLVAGRYVFALVVTDNSGAVSKADSVVVTVNNPVPVALYRINAGGPLVTNSIGTFAADAYYSPAPGNTYSTTTTIAQTSNAAMYQTERYGTNGTLSYAFPVSNGNYTVILHFAEIYWTAAGKRIFNVSIEGNKVLDKYDIFNKAGAFTATSETFPVSVTDGTLNIYFSSLPADGGVDQPKVSAIEILNTSAGTANIIPVANAGVAQTVNLPVNSAVLDGSASTDVDGSVVSYSWTETSGPGTVTFSPGATIQKPTVSGLVPGNYVFSLVVTDNVGGVSKPATVAVNVSGLANTQMVNTFTLVNAVTNQDIQTIGNGAIVNLATLPATSVNIRANTNPAVVGSVVFSLQGPQSRAQTETVAPYALFGDINGIYNPWIPVAGNYILTATPYTYAGGGGIAGTPLTITFSVVNQPAANAARGAITPEISEITNSPINTFKAYPNPNNTGRYTVSLNSQFKGQLSYSLFSVTGTRLTGGMLLINEPASLLHFDFSGVMSSMGQYYLLLEGKDMKGQTKLIRLK